MTQCRVYIGINLTITLLPPSAKGVVFGQVPTVRGIDHTIKACMVVIKVSILVIILAPKFRKLIFETFENVPLDAHEARGTIQDFYKSIFNGPMLSTKINH
jgi:hypothetical protein